MLKTAQDPYSWPRDQADFLFLGNAVNRMGRAYFKDQWTGREGEAPALFPLPSMDHSRRNASARADAHNLLSSIPGYIACPIIQKLPTSFALLGTERAKPAGEIRDYAFSERHWKIAQELRAKQIEEIAPSLLRLGKVRSDLTALFTEGRIRTGTRPKKQPDIRILPANVWSVINLSQAFSSYQIFPTEPGTIYCAGDRFEWLFVSKDDFDRYVAGHNIEPRKTDHGNTQQPAVSDLTVSQRTQPGRNKRRLTEYFEAKSVEGIWCGLGEDLEAIKKIPECANLPRVAVDEIRHEVASRRGATLPSRGRPKKSPSE